MISSIGDYLATDIISSTAAAAYSANTNYFSSSSVVPEYAYKSLSNLLLGSDLASSTLINSINYRPGEARDDADGEVSILFMPQEAVTYDFGISSNVKGAETTYMDIYIRLPEGETVEKVINIEMRIRYLLDYTWRTKRKTTVTATTVRGPFVPKMNDRTINGDIFCLWQGWVTPPNSRECAVRYVVSYDRCYTV